MNFEALSFDESARLVVIVISSALIACAGWLAEEGDLIQRTSERSFFSRSDRSTDPLSDRPMTPRAPHSILSLSYDTLPEGRIEKTNRGSLEQIRTSPFSYLSDRTTGQ
jgi:hypothetical protein